MVRQALDVPVLLTIQKGPWREDGAARVYPDTLGLKASSVIFLLRRVSEKCCIAL